MAPTYYEAAVVSCLLENNMKLIEILVVLLVVASQTKSFRLPYGPYVSRIGIVDIVWPRLSKECLQYFAFDVIEYLQIILKLKVW